MNILFVHQNFPGQYTHIAKALASDSRYRVVAIGLNPRPDNLPDSIHYIRYSLSRGNATGIHSLVAETETKIIRGEAVARVSHRLKVEGFTPDVICAHPGWGESLFLPDIWPNTPILSYQEFYYHPRGLDTDFDSELQPKLSWENSSKVRMKNAYLNLSLESSYWNLSPTRFQRSTFPLQYQNRMSTIHDGIDTSIAIPTDKVPSLHLPDGRLLKKGDKIITFVNRCLEPYRGCHTFIRSIPAIHQQLPDAHIVIVGSRKGVSYGAPCPSGEWSDQFLNEISDQYDPARLHFAGTVDHQTFLSLLQLSACHVYLTYPFVLSWSLLEAMSCGCPIVGSRTAPVEEVVEDGCNGLLIDFFSHNDLANAVVDLLSSADIAASLGSTARQTVIERYSLEKCLPGQLKLIDLVSSRALT